MAHAVQPCRPLLLDLQPDGDAWMLDGAPVRKLPVNRWHGRGRHQQGIFHSNFAGQAVVLKRVDQGALQELIKSGPGHLIGGPRMIGLARAPREGQSPLEFIVMEEIFAGRHSVTLQGYATASAAELTAGGLRMIAGAPAARLTRQLAEWLAQGYVHDILPPYDFDFITTDTELRLIDVGSLTVGRRAKTKDWDRFFVHVQLRLVGRFLELTFGRDVARYFRADVLAALRPLVDDDQFERMQMSAAEVYGDDGEYLPKTP